MCSAGVGRTGTFIAIDMELQRIKNEGFVDVYNTVHKLRFRRNFTVQTLVTYIMQLCNSMHRIPRLNMYLCLMP